MHSKFRRTLLFSLFAVTQGCTPAPKLQFANYSDKGVVVLGEIRHHLAIEDARDNKFYLSPGIPGPATDVSMIRKFNGYEKGIPKEMLVEWYYVDLADCKNTIASKSMEYEDDDPTIYVRRENCTMTYRPEKIYRKTFTAKQIKETEEYKKTGKRYLGIAGSSYSLIIRLEFRGDDVVLKTFNSASNPWR